MREELLDIYSSSGKKTGKKATKSYIHEKGLFHATVHVWIFSEKGNVLIQKRSNKKKLNPGVEFNELLNNSLKEYALFGRIILSDEVDDLKLISLREMDLLLNQNNRDIFIGKNKNYYKDVFEAILKITKENYQ